MQALVRASWGSKRSAVVLLGLALGGCAGGLPEGGPAGGEVKAVVAGGEVKGPRLAAVALSSIEGGPEATLAHFRQSVTSSAADHEITFTDPGLARYFARGYLHAYSAEGGTAVRSVWDIYDAAKQRSHRFDDGLIVPGTVADPWSAVDDHVVDSLAARSADAMATFLAGTPEAIGGAAVTASPAPVN